MISIKTANFLRVLLFSLILAVIQSCNNNNASEVQGTPPVEGEQIMFAITYDNWAFGKEHSSFNVRADGRALLSTNNQNVTQLIEDDQVYTHAALEERFDVGTTQVNQVTQNLLMQNYELLKQVDRSQLSEAINVGTDLGSMKFWGFVYRADLATYRSLLLAERGDWERSNQSDEAMALVAWLQKLVNDSGTPPFVEMR